MRVTVELFGWRFDSAAVLGRAREFDEEPEEPEEPEFEHAPVDPHGTSHAAVFEHGDHDPDVGTGAMGSQCATVRASSPHFGFHRGS